MRPGFAAVVREHWPDTVGYVVAGEPPCIRIQQDEVGNVQRRLEAVALGDVVGLEPEGSWFMAVLVCPGDDLGGLAAWARRQDHARVHFYLHAEADPAQLAPWRDAGLPLAHIDEGFTSWGPLHKVMGLDLNVVVYDDHAPPGLP